MRLTLRTLLAYLDDRLLPANAKELGQKIAKSPFATELVERIREVKRRRRLAMPDKPVAMIDDTETPPETSGKPIHCQEVVAEMPDMIAEYTSIYAPTHLL